MAPIALATMMEHIGDMSAISATVGENFIEEPGLHRTLIGDGIATALAGAFGGPANTTITMSHYIYNNSFGQGVANFGYASAMSFFVFILVAILAAINLKVGDTRD